MFKSLRDHRSYVFSGVSAVSPSTPGGFGHFCKIRILQISAELEKPAAFISSSTKARRSHF